MANELRIETAASPSLRPARAYGLAATCLALGLVLGFVLRGSQVPPAPQPSVVVPHVPNPHAMGSGHMPSQQELRKIADKQALPLIGQLRAKPDDASLMVQIGAIYHSTRQYPLAIEYYGKALSLEPRNAAVRNKLATSLYRSGDVDGAIAQLNQCLAYDSNDANSLFNLGVIRWEGKQDAQGAMAAWQRLLKSNPRLNADRKIAVKKMIAEVQSAAAAAPDPRSAN